MSKEKQKGGIIKGAAATITGLAIGISGTVYTLHDNGGQEPIKKQLVVYDREAYLQGHDMTTLSATALEGAKNVKAMANIPGYTFSGDEKTIKKIYENAKKENKNVMVIEDHIVTTDFLTGCEEKKEPVDPEIPGPSPLPTPIFTQIKKEIEKSWGVERLKTVEAWALSDGSEILSCVLDTGIDEDHPDVEVVGCHDFTGSRYGCDDRHGHGTHVAGIIAAKPNGVGVIGVSRSKLFNQKVLSDSGSGRSTWVANGIEKSIQVGCKIINMSLGRPYSGGENIMIKDAIAKARRAGVIVVSSAGNDGKRPGWPASTEGVIAVSAMTKYQGRDAFPKYSARGPRIDYIAPGSNILSTCRGGKYCTKSGTSMASPHVTGQIAILLQAGVEIATTQVINRDGKKMKADWQGKGMIDVLKSLK